MKLFVFGSNSPLGKSFTQLLKKESVEFVAVSDDAPSIYEAGRLATLINEAQPGQLLNLSLNPGIFQSETGISKERLDQLTQAFSTLLKSAKTQKIPLIHHSSVAVFDGSNPKPYLETDSCSPNNPLGKLALNLEKKAAKYEKHIILRTEGLFDSDTAFFDYCVAQCKQHQGKLNLLDQRCSPTSVIDVARVLLAINRQLECNANPWGVHQYCALQATYRHTFVEDFLTEIAGFDKTLAAVLKNLEISTQETSKAQLKNSVLDCQKIMASFGIKQRSRGAALKELLAEKYG
ncbi:sugar nucleotide-binding protein [Gammaproteobacteria bacterium AH-315-E17]|nr:sugar nucleotide-binding protein [Gammaproteobacteria bacterium AH-315-E17]